MKYDPAQIEPRWQRHWAEQQTFRTPNPGDEPAVPDAPHSGFDPDRPKFYVLSMFPYPSGAGMHIGHALNYTSSDIVARYRRMRGDNVLHPIGYDAFGLPAEQYAVEKGVHPRITTQQNIDNISASLKRLGLAIDWDRCFATTDPGYYKWTQWIFLKLYGSWFDPSVQRARPIAELERMLESGEMDVGPEGELVPVGAMGGMDALGGPPVGARKWHELDAAERRLVLDGYRLAYMDEVPVNWCPALGTVLANEEVTAEGKSERGDFPVYRRPLKQWMMRITAYAERLLADLDLVDWPEPVKLMQRNWIGRSEGAEVHFPLAYGTAESDEDVITVFTTRPDTLFGATYMVLAPEHPLVGPITTRERYEEVDAYVREAEAKSELDRQAESREKTGVFTGAYAINPVNNQQIPIWIADYVLMGYGTGAIMAVPAHDERDFEFARTYDLPIRRVVRPKDAPDDDGQLERAFTGEGVNVHSHNEEVSLDGLATAEAKQRIIEWLEQRGLGKRQVQYKLRDWLFSRQRYWGEPFPILHGPDGEVVALDESELPVELPEMEDFRPHAGDDPNAEVQTPLSRAPDQWKHVERDGVRYTRELNTMPQWAGSCWYYLRFCDPKNDRRFVGREAERYWMAKREGGAAKTGGVDFYIGGVEHAVLHLLYARFWHKVLYDLGQVSTPEPFVRLFNQGYIQAYSYKDRRGIYVPADEVEERDGRFHYRGEPVERAFGKMGKSLKNSVNPDAVCDEYGADSLRLYLMYLGPLDQSKLWNPRDIVGVHRFLQRLWRNVVDEETGELRVDEAEVDEATARLLARTVKRVTDAVESMGFNVGIAALIEMNNELVGRARLPRRVAETLVRLLAPFAPHVSEELWHRLGHEDSVANADWPSYDPRLLVEREVEYPVQVNGKLRGRVTVPADADEAAIEAAAKSDEKVAAALAGKTVRKAIVVKGRLVNLVAS